LAGVTLDEFPGSPRPDAAAGCRKSGLPISAGFPVFGFLTAGRSAASAVHHLKNNQDSQVNFHNQS
jgi:hypothetical protein